MGNYRVEMEFVGGHGCQREVKDGEKSIGCGRLTCPDCNAMRAVIDHQRHTGSSFVNARLVHWPGQSSQVVDEITLLPYSVERVRRGNF